MSPEPATDPIVASTASYEAWLATQMPILDADLEVKHRLMASAAFPFLSGTAYRWAERWPVVCSTLTNAPTILAVGDLHVENFGTWRDVEGRLVWGINDVDEATPLPYTSDLVRLVASSIVAANEEHLSIKPSDAAAAVLEGYRSWLETGGQALVLSENHVFLRDLAQQSLKDPERYWTHLVQLPNVSDEHLPSDMAATVRGALPEGTADVRLARRVAGVGSLGRPRVVATGHFRDGLVAREAKAIAASAWAWSAGLDLEVTAQAAAMSRLVVDGRRSLDPGWTAAERWLVRRLAPDCSRIELANLPVERDERKLLRFMGAETANLHLATPGAAAAIGADLARRESTWLEAAAKEMAADVSADQIVWAKQAAKSAGPKDHKADLPR